MFLDVSQALQNPDSEVPFQVSEALEAQELYGEQVSFDPVLLSGGFFVEGEKDNIVIHGKLSTTAHARCAKCLSPATYKVEISFHEMYVKGADPDDPDAENFAYEGTKIDLLPLALSLTVPALPMRFLCKKDCKGLCPVCGADCNISSCSCQKGSKTDNPFAALKQLLTKDEEV